jgi:hypothetical protein
MQVYYFWSILKSSSYLCSGTASAKLGMFLTLSFEMNVSRTDDTCEGERELGTFSIQTYCCMTYSSFKTYFQNMITIATLHFIPCAHSSFIQTSNIQEVRLCRGRSIFWHRTGKENLILSRWERLRKPFKAQWSLCITCFNIKNFRILPTDRVCVFRMILRINSYCFPNQC